MENSIGASPQGVSCFDRAKWFVGLNLIWFLLALLTGWLGWRSYTLSVDGAVAEGTVVRLLADGPAFDADFYPVVEYQVDGKTFTVQSQNNYRWWNRYLRFPVGGQVEVRYESGNPENAEVNSWWDLWNEIIFLGLFTMLVALAVNIFLIFYWRSRQAAAPG